MKSVSGIVIFAAVVCLVSLPGTVAAEDAVGVSGVWDLIWQGQQGPRTLEMTVEQDGEQLSGKVVGPRGQSTAFSGTLEGDKIVFVISFRTQRGSLEITYRGTVDGDSMSGTAEIRGETKEWSAARRS